MLCSSSEYEELTSVLCSISCTQKIWLWLLIVLRCSSVCCSCHHFLRVQRDQCPACACAGSDRDTSCCQVLEISLAFLTVATVSPVLLNNYMNYLKVSGRVSTLWHADYSSQAVWKIVAKLPTYGYVNFSGTVAVAFLFSRCYLY